MQAVLSISTAATLFIHAVFGCCWPHVHSRDHAITAAIAQPVSCCKHHYHGSDDRQQEKPRKCTVECEGTCNYLVPQKVQIDAPQTVALFDLIAAVPAVADVQAALARFWALGCSPQESAPPLRLHLLHQLLLI